MTIIDRVPASAYPALLKVWETSVRATHEFLDEAAIIELRPVVLEAFAHVRLYGLREADGCWQGFLGRDGENLAMLFLHPAARGRGLGRALVAHADAEAPLRRVDVNEQNPAARGFYERLGFVVAGRSPLDGQGRPFPLLHMERRNG